MKLRRALKGLLMAIAIQLLTVGVVSAETTDTQTGSSELTSDENLSLIDEDISALTGAQKIDRAAKKVKRMRAILETTTELLESVRDTERDIIKINCINEKLAAIKGFLKVSEQSYLNLRRAVDGDDTGAAAHHYTLLSVAHQKVQALAEEANLCTGEERRFAGRGEVEVTEPDNGAEDVDVPEDEILIEELPDLTPFR